MGWLQAAHFDKRFSHSWLQYFKEFLLREEVLGVVKEEGCDAVGRLIFDAFFARVGGGFVQKMSHSVVEGIMNADVGHRWRKSVEYLQLDVGGGLVVGK